jgi:DNA polymerase-3 subunit alpha
MSFVHLHVHSDFSLQDAAVSVWDLAAKAEELGMTHLALTDHGNMFGAMEFLVACAEDKKHNKRANPVMPIIGCEVYVSSGSRHDRDNDAKAYHMVLLSKNRQGYMNLMKLVSAGYTEGFYRRPRIDDELLKEYHEGLICLSACVSGEIPRLVSAGQRDEAVAKAVYYRDLFGSDLEDDGTGNLVAEPNFYLELQDHGITAEELRGSGLSERDVYHEIAAIGKEIGVPLVLKNDIHYLTSDHAAARRYQPGDFAGDAGGKTDKPLVVFLQ